MQKHGKSHKILQFLILEIGVHLRNLRIKWTRNLFWPWSKLRYVTVSKRW